MRKLSGTIQRRNDEQVGLLGADLHTASLPAGEDHYPDSDRRGLGTRAINRLGVGVYTDHFRSGVIPAGFAWQGAPFGGAPVTLNYSAAYEYLTVAAGGAGRYFLSAAVTNAAGSWQNLSIYGRCGARYSGRIGLRLDDGTDNNYAELYLDGTANTGAQTLAFRYRAGGGAVTTVTSTFAAPVDSLHVLRLLCYFAGGNYTVFGYPITERGNSVVITNFNTGVIAWAPAAGRVGIMLQTTGAADEQEVDWFYNTFT